MLELLWRRKPDNERGLIDVALEWAMAGDGCPICALVRKREHDSLWALLWENVNDPGIRAELRAGLGLCAAHTVALCQVADEEIYDNLGVSILFADFVAEAIQRLEAGQPPGAANCPQCRRGRSVAATYVGKLLTWLGQGRHPLGPAAAGRLCLPHARLAVAWSGSQVRALLLAHTQSAVTLSASEARASPGRLLTQLHGAAALPRPWPAARWRLGCPVCANAGQAEVEMATALAAGARQGAPGEGLCAHHTVVLLSKFDPDRGTAWLVGQLRDLSAHLADYPLPPPPRPWRRASPLVPPSPTCWMCAALKERWRAMAAAPTDVTAVVDGLLCLPHLRQCSATPATAAAREEALDAQVSRLRSLVGELREHIRKHGWENRCEARGEEQTAWLRAARWCTGDLVERQVTRPGAPCVATAEPA